MFKASKKYKRDKGTYTTANNISPVMYRRRALPLAIRSVIFRIRAVHIRYSDQSIPHLYRLYLGPRYFDGRENMENGVVGTQWWVS